MMEFQFKGWKGEGEKLHAVFMDGAGNIKAASLAVVRHNAKLYASGSAEDRHERVFLTQGELHGVKNNPGLRF